MTDVYTFGAVRVLIDSSTGAILAVQCRITGQAASLMFSPEYISRAIAQAHMAWASTTDVS